MYRSILVPLDGSVFAEQALPLAADLAKRAGATLHLVLVHQSTVIVPGPGEPVVLEPELEERQRVEEATYMEMWQTRLAFSGGAVVVASVLEGTVADAIAGYAQAHAVDLVVMTTHGRGVLSRFWLGSVADRLVRQLERPLLLLRPQAAAGPAASQHAPSFRRIALALDGSPHAELMIEPALALAHALGAELTLVRVVEQLAPLWLPTAGLAPVPDADAMPRRQREATSYLAQVASRLGVRGERVATTVESAPDPVTGITAVVEREGMGAIALATHGHGGPVRLLLGSVADKLVRAATVPLLVWRPRLQEKSEEPAIAFGTTQVTSSW